MFIIHITQIYVLKLFLIFIYMTTSLSFFFKGRFEEDHALHGAHQLQAPDGRGPLRPQPQPRRRNRFCR